MSLYAPAHKISTSKSALVSILRENTLGMIQGTTSSPLSILAFRRSAGTYAYIKSTTTYEVASEVAMLALSAYVGDICKRTDTGTAYVLKTDGASTLAHWVQISAAAVTTLPWSAITATPTTLTGYGITDAQPLDADLTAIAALSASSGVLTKTAANTWALNTSAVLPWASGTNLVLGTNATAGVGAYNTILGTDALPTGAADSSSNTAFGYYALNAHTAVGGTSGLNTAIGANTLRSLVWGSGNVAIGASSLYTASGVNGNIGIGYGTLSGYAIGSYNIGIGYRAGGSLTASKANNVFIGTRSGYTASASGCVCIGHYAGESIAVDNSLVIANTNTTTPLIAGRFDTAALTINGTLFSTGILSVGSAVAESWAAGFSVAGVGTTGRMICYVGAASYFGHNAYYGSSAWRRISTGGASFFALTDRFEVFCAASGAADSALSVVNPQFAVLTTGISTTGTLTATGAMAAGGAATSSTAALTLPATTTGVAPLNLGVATTTTAPASPVAGDIWINATNGLSYCSSAGTARAVLDSATNQDVTGNKNFYNNTLRIYGAGVGLFTIAGASMSTSRTITLPALTANDTFAVLGLAQTVTNSWTARQLAQTVQTSATTTGAITWTLTSGGNMYLSAALTGGVTMNITAPVAGTISELRFIQGATAQTVTLSMTSVVFRQTGGTGTGTGTYSITGINAVNGYYAVSLYWATTTLCYVTVS